MFNYTAKRRTIVTKISQHRERQKHMKIDLPLQQFCAAKFLSCNFSAAVLVVGVAFFQFSNAEIGTRFAVRLLWFVFSLRHVKFYRMLMPTMIEVWIFNGSLMITLFQIKIFKMRQYLIRP